MNGENCPEQLPAKTLQKTCKNHSNEQKRDLSTGPGPESTSLVSAFRKQNIIEKSRVRTRRTDIGGRWRERERAGTRADVNKPRAGASDVLTILGIFESVVTRCGRSGTRSEERRRRQREKHKHTVTQGCSARTRYIRTRYVPSYTTVAARADAVYVTASRSRLAVGTRREQASDDLALQRAPSRVPRRAPPRRRALRPSRTYRPQPRAGPNAAPPRSATAPRAARPTSGESRITTRCRHDGPQPACSAFAPTTTEIII